MTKATTSNRDTNGVWITPPVSYVDPQRLSCELCGRPIARRYWRQSITGIERTFCEPDHAALYESYWVPVWGRNES